MSGKLELCPLGPFTVPPSWCLVHGALDVRFPLDVARYYGVDDIPNAASLGSRLNNVLTALAKGQRLTDTSRVLLTSKVGDVYRRGSPLLVAGLCLMR